MIVREFTAHNNRDTMDSGVQMCHSDIRSAMTSVCETCHCFATAAALRHDFLPIHLLTSTSIVDT
jgi:hypothetical protein